MNRYRIISPTGIVHSVWAETTDHAFNMAMALDNFNYPRSRYRKFRKARHGVVVKEKAI